MRRFLGLIFLLAVVPAAVAQVTVECVQATTDSAKTRLVLASSGPISHQILTLTKPDRVVIDIAKARLIGSLPKAELGDRTLVGLRSGIRDQGDLRVVLDLKQPVRVKSFIHSEQGTRGENLVVDLYPRGSAKSGHSSGSRSREDIALAPRGSRTRTAIIAIDAGHGGQDPGAIGAHGTREKDVTLAIARRLATLVNRQRGMRAVMIRDGDYFVALRDRIKKARDHHADLFISIHADAFNNADASGSSVYTLSQNGASSEAANWLANRENSADEIAGIDPHANDEVLTEVLLSMTQNATLEHSSVAAKAVLTYLDGLGNLHKQNVQRAGFVVLKSPDIPSVLVETAFISNAAEERRLKSSAHQYRLAQAIFSGVKAYFRKYPAQGFASSSDPEEDGGFSRPLSSVPPRRVPAPG